MKCRVNSSIQKWKDELFVFSLSLSVLCPLCRSRCCRQRCHARRNGKSNYHHYSRNQRMIAFNLNDSTHFCFFSFSLFSRIGNFFYSSNSFLTFVELFYFSGWRSNHPAAYICSYFYIYIRISLSTIFSVGCFVSS